MQWVEKRKNEGGRYGPFSRRREKFFRDSMRQPQGRAIVNIVKKENQNIQSLE